MALLQNILAGMGIGNATTDIIVRYSKSQYEEKINRLSDCARQLEAHLNTLTGLKDRMKTVWDDEKGREYNKEIEKEIKAVQNAQEQVNRQIELWSAAIKEMEDTVTEQKEKIDLVHNMVKSLDIKD